MNIFDALEKDHDAIRDLFGKVKEDPEKFPKLKKHLEVHHRNEEKFLLDELKKKEDFRDEALESIEEHYLLDFLLLDLDNFPKDHERWKIKLGVLKEVVDHHLEEEEDDIFKEGKENLDDEEMKKWGEKFEENKKEQLEVL